MLTIRVPEHPGTCRICRCTHMRPCDVGCGWANRQQTLCTACVDVDQALRTARGRTELRDALDETRRLARALERGVSHPRPRRRSLRAR